MKTKTSMGIRIAGLLCLLLSASLLLAACEVDYGDDGGYDDGNSGWNNNGDGGNNGTYSCPTFNETDIHGVENDQWAKMNNANGLGQVYLQTIRNPDHFMAVQWTVGQNRQTCSTGPVVESHGANVLQIGTSDAPGNYMNVDPGLNYIDYQAYGCTPSDCDTLIESGTIVLDVNVP